MQKNALYSASLRYTLNLLYKLQQPELSKSKTTVVVSLTRRREGHEECCCRNQVLKKQMSGDETARSVADLDRNFIIFLMWWIECEVEQQMLMWILKVRWQTSLPPRSSTLLRGVTEQSPTLIVGTELAGEKWEEKWMISDLSSCTFKHVRDIPGQNILDTKRKIL